MIPPSSNPRPILTVVSNTDEKFMPGMAVATASAVVAASGEYDYRFLILNDGRVSGALLELEKTLKEIGAKQGISVTLESLVVDQTRLMALPERRGSRMTYAKLVLPEILPDLDSIIYLDADVLCFTGLENVKVPMGQGHWLLAGALDFFSVIEKDCPWIEHVPTSERRLPYINCGVMWMNLKGLREMHFTENAITARASILNARQGDQSVFNFLCRGKSYILPEAINHRTSIGATRPLCEGNLDLNLHYIGSPKPWLGSPKTSNWLAHQLWHQASAALFPTGEKIGTVPFPHDSGKIRGKALLYAFTNPARAVHYRSDLRSLSDPAQILEKAASCWAI